MRTIFDFTSLLTGPLFPSRSNAEIKLLFMPQITSHMPPEDMISQKVVTIKTVCSIKAFRILGVKLHNFQNTFHQLFWRYGNPDMHFLGTLKIEFLILDV